MSFFLRSATAEDVPHLAAMNQRLIEDESSRNPMDGAQLKQRFRLWLNAPWGVELFHAGEDGKDTVGYCVYRTQRDAYRPGQPVVYIRQFYIERERRRQGIGRQAFILLRTTRFPAGADITLEVLARNERGQAFWGSLGFGAYSVTMKRLADGSVGET